MANPNIQGARATLASKPVMLLGNLTSILVTIVALLQALSWTIAGILILVTLSITTLLPIGNLTGSAGRSQSKKSGNHLTLPESKYPRERAQEKQTTRPHQGPARPEQKPLPKHEPSKSPAQLKADFQNPMIPKITPPKTIPAVDSPSKTIRTNPKAPKLKTPTPIPPKTPAAILSPPEPAA